MPVTTVSDLLHLLTREPGRPRITWYGDGGERVELSGAVLENWVNKTANLLVEEFDAGPGTRVLLDLPGHWRTVVWALATWRVGGTVVVGAEGGDVVVTDMPEAYPDTQTLIAVALPALARSFGVPLPSGTIDASSAVMTYGDVFAGAPVTADAPLLCTLNDETRAIRSIFEAGAPGAAGGRQLLTADPRGDVRTLVRMCAVLASAGSVVLVAPQVAADTAHVARLRETERVAADA